MKKLLVLVLLLLGAMLAYNYATRGELTLLPRGPVSGEELELERLEKDFKTAVDEFNQALRSAGLAGLDTTGDADAAMGEVQRIERKLEQLMRRLVTDDERRKAENLKRRLQEFKRKAGA